jgi:hypothetical protein
VLTSLLSELQGVSLEYCHRELGLQESCHDCYFHLHLYHPHHPQLNFYLDQNLHRRYHLLLLKIDVYLNIQDPHMLHRHILHIYDLFLNHFCDFLNAQDAYLILHRVFRAPSIEILVYYILPSTHALFMSHQFHLFSGFHHSFSISNLHCPAHSILSCFSYI